MKKFKLTKKFEKDLKKFGLEPTLIEVLNHLMRSETLPIKYKDHQLTGNLKEYRDCHIKPDLVLLYRVEQKYIELYRLNTHSEIFS